MLSDREQTVLLAIERHGTLTVDEFVTARKGYVNSWAPTFTGLRKDGLIRRTGGKRRTSHGSEAHVLELTVVGKTVLDSLAA